MKKSIFNLMIFGTAAIHIAALELCTSDELYIAKSPETNGDDIARVGDCSTMTPCLSDNGDHKRRDNSMCPVNETCATYLEGANPKTSVSKSGCVNIKYYKYYNKSGYILGYLKGVTEGH